MEEGLVEGKDVFRKVVLDATKCTKFTLGGGLVGNVGGDLEVDFRMVAFGDEVDFFVVVFADVDLVAVRDKLMVDEVLEYARQISATPAVDGIEETDVGEVTFFLGFEKLFVAEVVAFDSLDNHGLFEPVEVFVDCVLTEGDFLVFEIVADGFGGNVVADIVHDESSDAREEVSVADILTFHEVFIQDGVVDVGDFGVVLAFGLSGDVEGREAASL